MIRMTEEKFKELSERIHEVICRKTKNIKQVSEEVVTENRIFGILYDDPGIQPSKCAIRLNDEYGYDLTGWDVISMLRRRKLNHPEERTSLFEWAGKVTDHFEKAMGGDKEAFEKFETLRREKPAKMEKSHESQGRICAFMIIARNPELVTEEDYAAVENAGNTIGKYIFYSIIDAVREVYGFPAYKKFRNSEDPAQSEMKITIDQAEKRIILLENELESTSSMLSELQNEFEEQLSESKIRELTEFFTKLNSEKYGCILDQLLELSKGINELRKNGIEVPVEINGALILIKKLIQFVRDSHIDPIMKPDSEMIVTASDVEYCNYSGTPFSNESEEKIIKVLSPGWIYRDKEIQISRPRVEEL